MITQEQQQILFNWIGEQMLRGSSGRHLNDDEVEWAKLVGVKDTDRVKIVNVEEMPKPPEQLKELSLKHLNLKHAAGLTIGWTIFIKDTYYSRKLVQHELRHVYQIESLGLKDFLMKYVEEVMTIGYHDCPLEKDAVAASVLL